MQALVLFVLLICSAHAGRGREVIGYWQDWVNVNWWGNNIPGNCLMGCAEPDVFLQMVAPYSQVNYGFTFLTENPLPKQDSCSNSTSNCPVWDGVGIYAAQSYKNGATVVNAASTVHTIDNSPGLISISEVCRLARQGPTGPKRCLISFGGWSDWARLGNTANAQKAAKLAAKMVLFAFADGIDLDFEHLTEYSRLPGGGSEFEAFNVLIQTLRQEFNAITSSVWSSTIDARSADLQAAYNAMPEWQRSQSPYYQTNINYLQQVKQNGLPHFEISWTTRFNAFINKTNPNNFLDPSSPVPPPFATNNEGVLIWPISGDALDTVNIMAYDGGSPAGALKFNFQAILRNFITFGPPASKINMGFEPGNQYAGGIWEGLAKDQEVAKYVRSQGFGGGFVWAINPDPAVAPESAHWAPIVAQALSSIIEPQWSFGPTPTYSKVNPQTGWDN